MDPMLAGSSYTFPVSNRVQPTQQPYKYRKTLSRPQKHGRSHSSQKSDSSYPLLPSTPPSHPQSLAQHYQGSALPWPLGLTSLTLPGNYVDTRSTRDGPPPPRHTQQFGNGANQRRPEYVIPDEMIDLVDLVGPSDFELCFPLAHMDDIRRTALGIGNARMLLVRIRLPIFAPLYKRDTVEFCMHLDLHLAGVSLHNFWRVSTNGTVPDSHFCGTQVDRMTYQVNRILWRHLRGGDTNLISIHRLITRAINSLSQSCMSCGNAVEARLLRPTTCRRECSLQLRRSSLEVRLADIRHDPPVVDLLLTAVFGAVVAHMTSLLVGCPIADAKSLHRLLDAMPAVATLDRYNLASAVRALGREGEALLSWACTSYRGFLVSATGQLKVPNMPKVHQFVLANATPELERRFAIHMKTESHRTHIVFHGTSLGRLYAILREGLQICSGTSLERNGAAYGDGIYVADEPGTTVPYSNPYQGADAISGWRRSAYHTVRVLLGCELARKSEFTTSSQGMYVVRDSTCLMVRFVFLLEQGASVPTAAHMVPAMTSALAALRLSRRRKFLTSPSKCDSGVVARRSNLLFS